MNLVVSQPMFLPWIGLFEQVRLADRFIHYDDVQLPQGRSFISRVQVKGPDGVRWLTAPIDRRRSGRTIRESWYVEGDDWRDKHLRTLGAYYGEAPYFPEMFDLAEKIYAHPSSNVAEFNANAVELVAAWLGIGTSFGYSSACNVGGRSSVRLLEIAKKTQATKYITGLGALKYLDHEIFEREKIEVAYMSYQNHPWPQLHGEFVPYVTILDPIANCGKEAALGICSSSIYWREYIELTK